MTLCSLAPADKKSYARDIGEILFRTYGKKKFYSPEQVKRASSQSRYNIDWHCWAMCIFSSPADFNAYHKLVGETCDYASMKAEMTLAITDGDSDAWFDIDLSWLEWPDFELPSIFDFLD
jgi:hypothetical protein